MIIIKTFHNYDREIVMKCRGVKKRLLAPFIAVVYTLVVHAE